MNELKLVPGDEVATGGASGLDLSKANPMDALNRRDIELIKRSLASMHKDCAELRNAIVALHGRQSRAPSKRFFLGLGALALVLVTVLSAERSHLDAVLHHVPFIARLTASDINR